MADKPRDWSGLNVNFQNLPPKAGAPPLWLWAKLTIIGLALLAVARLLAWLI